MSHKTRHDNTIIQTADLPLIERQHYLARIAETFKTHSVCCLLGPRQCGKTTLAKTYSTNARLFDLEDPFDLEQFDNPKLLLENLEGLIVIDEIQRRPELFPYLRVLVDRYPDRQYLILGSASRDLIQQSSETLAGRIGCIEMTPFQFTEVPDQQTRLWQRGGFPKSFLAATDDLSFHWRLNFIRTFWERDIPSLDMNPMKARGLWTMIAHYHGNIFNPSVLGANFGLSKDLMYRYLSRLEENYYLIRLLKSWPFDMFDHQVKFSKIYIRDSGLLHALLKMYDVSTHRKLGASWEGFALEEILRAHRFSEAYFWSLCATEVDLLIKQHNGRIEAFEFKCSKRPKLSKGMLRAIDALELDELKIVIPLEADFRLHDKVHVVGLANCLC